MKSYIKGKAVNCYIVGNTNIVSELITLAADSEAGAIRLYAIRDSLIKEKNIAVKQFNPDSIMPKDLRLRDAFFPQGWNFWIYWDNSVEGPDYLLKVKQI